MQSTHKHTAIWLAGRKRAHGNTAAARKSRSCCTHRPLPDCSPVFTANLAMATADVWSQTRRCKEMAEYATQIWGSTAVPGIVHSHGAQVVVVSEAGGGTRKATEPTPKTTGSAVTARHMNVAFLFSYTLCLLYPAIFQTPKWPQLPNQAITASINWNEKQRAYY